MSREYFRAIPAAYVLLMKDESVLLSRRQNTGYADGQLALPAGHIDGGELASRAAAREALEEIGVRIAPANLEFVHVSHRLNANEPDQERIDFFFRAIKWDGQPVNQEPDKASELLWAPVRYLPVDVLPYIRTIIGHVLNGNRFSEYETDPNI